MKRIVALGILVLVLTISLVPIYAEPLEPPLISINFDDGSVTVYENAFPIMQDRGLTGTVYIPTARIDDWPSAMTWNQLDELYAAGWEIASHSVNHQLMTGMTEEEMRYELGESKETLINHGYDCRTFVTPNGKTNDLLMSLIPEYYDYQRSPMWYSGCGSYPYDPYLAGYPVMPRRSDSPQTIITRLDRNINRNLWTHLNFHNLQDQGNEYTYPIDAFTEIMDWIIEQRDAGRVRVVTMIEGFNPDTEPPPPPTMYELDIASTVGGTTVPANGTYLYEEATNVQVTAYPDPNYTFVAMTLDGINYTSNPLSIPMDSNHTLVPIFEAIPPPPPPMYELEINAGTGGMTIPTSGMYTHDEGTIVEITAYPDPNWTFVAWDLDGVNVTDNPLSVLMDANHTVTPIFEAIPPPPESAPVVPLFTVASNSTVSEIHFQSTGIMDFIVSGPTGTVGVTNVTISQHIVTDPSVFRVYLDGEEIDFDLGTSGDYWVISFVYSHSSHQLLLVFSDT